MECYETHCIRLGVNKIMDSGREGMGMGPATVHVCTYQ